MKDMWVNGKYIQLQETLETIVLDKTKEIIGWVKTKSDFYTIIDNYKIISDMFTKEYTGYMFKPQLKGNPTWRIIHGLAVTEIKCIRHLIFLLDDNVLKFFYVGDSLDEQETIKEQILNNSYIIETFQDILNNINLTIEFIDNKELVKNKLPSGYTELKIPNGYKLEKVKKINLKSEKVEHKSKRLCIAIQPSLLKKIKQQAILNQLSTNETILQLIKIGLEE